MNKIILFTTQGCEGCVIAERLLKRVVENKNIKLEVNDVYDYINASEQNKHFISRYFINDYPTTVFMRDNEVLTKCIGTMSMAQIEELIKYYYL